MTDAIECKVCNGTGRDHTAIGPLECEKCEGTGRVPLPLNPWRPLTNAMDLKHLGKLAEECAELNAAIARCIIQGVDECEPVTGKSNRKWLTDEIADVLANINLVTSHFDLSKVEIEKRATQKIAHLRRWHAIE